MPLLAASLTQFFVALAVVRVQQDFPEILAHLLQLILAVAQGLAQMVVAVDHSAGADVLHIQVVGDCAHHVGPEALALQQRQLGLLAIGDVIDAENHRIEVLRLLRQTHHQP